MYCVDVKMGVRNVVCNDQIFDLWCHTEIKELRIFGEKIAGKPITYENLKALRGYTRICSKAVRLVYFVDEFNIKQTLCTKASEKLFPKLHF